MQQRRREDHHQGGRAWLGTARGRLRYRCPGDDSIAEEVTGHAIAAGSSRTLVQDGIGVDMSDSVVRGSAVRVESFEMPAIHAGLALYKLIRDIFRAFWWKVIVLWSVFARRG